MKKRLREWRLDPEAYVRRRWRRAIDRPKHEGHGPGTYRPRMVRIRVPLAKIRRALQRAWRKARG